MPETWLDADQVVTAIGDDLEDQLDEVALQFWCDGVREFVEDRRGDLWDLEDDDAPVYRPGARVTGGAVLLAYRLYQRRNTPVGVIGFDGGAASILHNDPDIGRMLGIGRHRRFAFGGAQPLDVAVVV